VRAATALSSPGSERRRRAAFRLARARPQTGHAALVLAGGYAAIIGFNLITERSATFVDYVPNLVSIVVLLIGAWLYARTSTPVPVLPWIASVVSLVLVLLLLFESWRDNDNPSVEYALIIMVVFSQFVLSFPSAVTAAVPMLVGYVVVSTESGSADLGDAALIGITALAVGMVALNLRIRLTDSLATALDVAEALATHDGQTGALNRRGLTEQMPGMLADAALRGGAISVAFVDIDGMKPINDTHGHAIGDEVVRIVAETLRGAACPGDLVARWGGDEFVVISATERGSNGEAVVVRLTAQVKAAALGHPSWGGDVTVGVAIGDALGKDWESLVGRADDDMYARKRGRAGGTS